MHGATPENDAWEGLWGAAVLPDWFPVADFYVEGRVAPKGSKSAFKNKRTGMVNQVEASKYVKPWQKAIVDQTPDFARKLWDVPLRVNVDFYQLRPKTVKRRYPTVDPDGDKLLRAVYDGLQQAKVIKDDNLIIEGRFRLFYAPENMPPGARIQVAIERWGEE